MKRIKVLGLTTLLCVTAFLLASFRYHHNDNYNHYSNECRRCGNDYQAEAQDSNYDDFIRHGQCEQDGWTTPLHNSSGQVQTRLLTLSKRTPAKAAVDEEVEMEIVVYASENIADLLIKDTFDGDYTLVKTEPEAAVDGKQLSWSFPSLNKGESRTVKVWIKTDQEGCLNDCLTATAIPRLCSSICFGKCLVCVESAGPESLSVGRYGTYTITVSNKGASTAHQVVVTNTLPAGLEESRGRKEIVWNVGELFAGEQRSYDLRLKAIECGHFSNIAKATASNAPEATTEIATEVICAKIGLSNTSLEEQVAGKSVDFTITATNQGTATLSDVSITDILPPGTELIKAEGAHFYEDQASWYVGNLTPGESKSVTVTLNSPSPGEHCNRTSVCGYNQLCGTVRAFSDCTCNWKGQAQLLMQVVDTCNPLLISESTDYNIRIINQGSEDDHHVEVSLTLPSELEAVSATGDAQGTINGKTVTFPPYETLSSGEVLQYTVRAKAVTAGEARTQVQLRSESLQEPVTEEQNTFVY